VAKDDLITFLRQQQLRIPPELMSSPPRVLIVDDEVSVTKWLAQEIKAKHPEFEIFEANDGYSAGETVASCKPDVVVLDLRMPGLDGFEVCRHIKSKPETQDTAIIAVTAHHSDKARRRILDLGARAYLTKPLDIDALTSEVLSAMLERS